MAPNDLAICELIHPHFKGTAIENSGHYLVLWFISYNEFISHKFQKILNDMREYYWTREISPPHPFIRSYWNILAKKKYYTLQIVEGFELSSGENVAILKTCWLRIFQRKCRNILKERKVALQKRKELSYREIHGRWR